MTCNEKFAIIDGDIHRLIRLPKTRKQDHFLYPWMIHEKRDYFWVPVQNWKLDNKHGKWIYHPFDKIDHECQACMRRWYSGAKSR